MIDQAGQWVGVLTVSDLLEPRMRAVACGGIARAGESACLPANGVIMLQPGGGYVAQPWL